VTRYLNLFWLGVAFLVIASIWALVEAWAGACREEDEFKTEYHE